MPKTVGTDNVNNMSLQAPYLNDGTVTEAKLANNAVTTNKINNTAVTKDKLNADVAGAGIAGGAGSALAVELAATPALEFDAVGDAGKLQVKVDSSSVERVAGGLQVKVDDSTIERNVGGIRVKALGITGSHIANSTITGSKVAASTIAGSNIANDTIATGNIANGAVTKPKMSATNYAQSSLINAGVYSGVIAGSTVTITTTGRPVLLIIHADTTNAMAGLTTTGTSAYIRRNSTQLVHIMYNVRIPTVATTSWTHFDVPPAGTHSYDIVGYESDLLLTDMRFTAIELV